MKMDERIARINELAHKKKSVGLTLEELDEQATLRREFLDDVRGNLRAQLNNIDMVNEDGTVENLGEKFGKNNN